MTDTLLKVIGSVSIVALGAFVLQMILKRRDERIADAADREQRVSSRVDRYVSIVTTRRNSNEWAAIEAGVLDLRNWAEIRDFSDRATARTPGDPVIPSSRRPCVRDENLRIYFERWAETNGKNLDAILLGLGDC